MLRVGLTGGLGSGKSTVAAMLREHGAHVIEADEVGRALMEPGQAVYNAIIHHFGRGVVRADNRLDRPRLAQIAFGQGRLDELNSIIHPAVIAAQQQWMDEIFARDPNAVAVVESALIFEVERDARARGESAGVLAGVPGDRSSSPGWLADWRNRFDRVIVLTAPDEVKIARYVARICPDPAARPDAEADARTRLARQMPDAEKAARADFVIENTGDLASLKKEVAIVWQRLQAESSKPQPHNG
ncbi:MAG: dephospho-CoA kinase [Acidobacteriota bacterium]